jgi:hypothetical protein
MSISTEHLLFDGLTPVSADPDKADPRQRNTEPPVASWGVNRFVSNDFFQVQ